VQNNGFQMQTLLTTQTEENSAAIWWMCIFSHNGVFSGSSGWRGVHWTDNKGDSR